MLPIKRERAAGIAHAYRFALCRALHRLSLLSHSERKRVAPCELPALLAYSAISTSNAIHCRIGHDKPRIMSDLAPTPARRITVRARLLGDRSEPRGSNARTCYRQCRWHKVSSHVPLWRCVLVGMSPWKKMSSRLDGRIITVRQNSRKVCANQLRRTKRAGRAVQTMA